MALCDGFVTKGSDMFSLQKLLGKEDKFFDLLEASAAEGRACVQALSKLLKSPDRARTLEDFVASRRKEKKIANEISEAVATTFVTALEREDIEALSFALYRIPKTIEKIAERFLLAPHLVADIDISRQLAMMEKATDTLTLMIKELRGGVNLEQIKAHNDTLQALEGEADKLVLDLLRDLYSGRHEPLQAVFLKELYDLLEKVTDRCRDAGNVINHIVLKNS
jgi:uncharacterized protein Yka (UPF0111/DUF47 family)